MIGWCDACGKGPVPCAYSNSYCGETVQCYVCAEGEFDPYGEMGDLDKKMEEDWYTRNAIK